MTKIAYLDKPDFDYKQKEKLQVSCGLSELDAKGLGRVGENLACTSLYDRGYKIVERNWKTKFGEADIIARDNDTTVLVEVKTRVDKGSDETLMPEIAVDDKKQDIYTKMAMYYLGQHPEQDHIRVDVIAVVLTSTGAHVHHLLGAVSCDA